VSPCVAEQGTRFEDPQLKFSLLIPEEFQRVEVAHPGVPLALVPKKGGYPTFNVTLHAGNYRPVSSNSHRESIISSYRQVGLTDASISETLELSTAQSKLVYPALAVTYSNQGKNLVSLVAPIPFSADHHFILTFIDDARHMERARTQFSQILSSFSLAQSPATPPRESKPGTIILLVVLLFMIVAVTVVKVTSRGPKVSEME